MTRSTLRRRAAPVAMVLAALGAVLTACGGSSSSSSGPSAAAALTAAATFSPPPDTGSIQDPESGQPLDLATYGYEEQEYFASGTARAFAAVSTPADGDWTVRPTTSASYETRIIVRRPTDPARFNGTVLVEWLNESAGESSPDWEYMSPEIMRAGFVWVGVSAQSLGVEGGSALLAVGSGALKGLVQDDPARYGALHHPGDAYALDLFAQVGRGLAGPGGRLPLGGLRPRHVVALGESQSAAYLTTFADAVQPLTKAYDGLFIHSRGGAGAPLNGSSVADAFNAGDVRIRTDLGVPVFLFETQTDLVQLGYAPAAQPDTATVRTWEVAGTSHADAWEVGSAASLIGCTTPVNAGPQHEVAEAALAAFGRWVDGGPPPPRPPRFELKSVRPAVLALDAHGNVIGGVRTPDVDVPVSTLSGSPPAGATVLCGLFGSTTPFSAATLTALYHDKATYLAKYTADLDRAIRQGYILAADRATLLAQAEQVQF